MINYIPNLVEWYDLRRGALNRVCKLVGHISLEDVGDTVDVTEKSHPVHYRERSECAYAYTKWRLTLRPVNDITNEYKDYIECQH